MEPMERAHEEIRRLKRLNRHLRNEIRVLHQRLRDANRGAERNMHLAHLQAQRIRELTDRLMRMEGVANIGQLVRELKERESL